MNISIATIQGYLVHPLTLLAVFLAASLMMIWRLHAMEGKGFEGTVLGTLIMPYCSGFPNLVFAYVMSSSAKNGGLVIENSLVNNVTNLTLILGLAAIFGSAAVIQKGATKRKAREHAEFHRINRLNLLFTLIALFLFTGTLWALAKDGVLDFYDGLVLVGLFLFWQVLHVFEVLKDNIRKDKSFHWSLLVDLLLLGVSAYFVYFYGQPSGGLGFDQQESVSELCQAGLVQRPADGRAECLPRALLHTYRQAGHRDDFPGRRRAYLHPDVHRPVCGCSSRYTFPLSSRWAPSSSSARGWFISCASPSSAGSRARSATALSVSMRCSCIKDSYSKPGISTDYRRPEMPGNIVEMKFSAQPVVRDRRTIRSSCPHITESRLARPVPWPTG